MATYTRDQILEAASTCTNITALAQRLGCCGSKLSGGTAKRLRAICPELEGILRGNKEGTSTVCPAEGKLSPNDIPDDENPYRAGSVYHQIYRDGSKTFQTKADLIAKVSSITGKSPKCIGYSLEVLCRKSHSSNQGRSTALRDDEAKTIKLISLSKKPIHASDHYLLINLLNPCRA